MRFVGYLFWKECALLRVHLTQATRLFGVALAEIPFDSRNPRLVHILLFRLCMICVVDLSSSQSLCTIANSARHVWSNEVSHCLSSLCNTSTPSKSCINSPANGTVSQLLSMVNPPAQWPLATRHASHHCLNITLSRLLQTSEIRLTILWVWKQNLQNARFVIRSCIDSSLDRVLLATIDDGAHFQEQLVQDAAHRTPGYNHLRATDPSTYTFLVRKFEELTLSGRGGILQRAVQRLVRYRLDLE